MTYSLETSIPVGGLRHPVDGPAWIPVSHARYQTLRGAVTAAGRAAAHHAGRPEIETEGAFRVLSHMSAGGVHVCARFAVESALGPDPAPAIVAGLRAIGVR